MDVELLEYRRGKRRPMHTFRPVHIRRDPPEHLVHGEGLEQHDEAGRFLSPGSYKIFLEAFQGSKACPLGNH